MVLQFNPYPVEREQPQPNEGLQILDRILPAAQMYLQNKQSKAALQAQREAKMVDLAKAGDEGGENFWNTYNAIKAGRNPYGTGIPAAPGAPAQAQMPQPQAGPTMPPADPYAQYQSIQEPYGLPDSPARPPMSMAQGAQPSPAPAPAAPAAPTDATVLTAAHLADIRKQRGSRGLKEFMDQQNFMTGQQKDQASMSNMNIDNESKLRGDYSKASGNFKVVSEQIQTIQSIAQRAPSAAGDLSLIFSYMKLVDPGSTVREGEQASAANAAGVPDRLRALYNRVMTGERLAPAQRGDFINTSGDLYQGWLDKQKQTDDSFRGIANRSRVNPENVILPYGVPNFDRASLAKMPGTVSTMGGGAPPPNPPQGGAGGPPNGHMTVKQGNYTYAWNPSTKRYE